MELDSSTNTLFIFGGSADDETYLSDMWTYDLTTNTATEVSSNFTMLGGPEPCFTQRTVIDITTKEIYAYAHFLTAMLDYTPDNSSRSCGLTRSHEPGAVTSLQAGCPHWIYQYHQRPGRWAQISHNRTDHKHPTGAEPASRYAHQVVYNPVTRTMYMHGGNGGETGALEDETRMDTTEGDSPRADRRLDDFWAMYLTRYVSSRSPLACS